MVVANNVASWVSILTVKCCGRDRREGFEAGQVVLENCQVQVRAKPWPSTTANADKQTCEAHCMTLRVHRVHDSRSLERVQDELSAGASLGLCLGAGRQSRPATAAATTATATST